MTDQHCDILSVIERRRCAPTRTEVKRGPNSLRPPRAGTPVPPPSDFPLGPPLCGASAEPRCDGRWCDGIFQRSWAGRWRTSKKQRSMEKGWPSASGRRMGIGTPYKGPMSLTRLDVMRGPGFTSTGPVQEPPPLTSSDFPCGPATLWGRVQSMCDGFGGAFKFRPLDKDEAGDKVGLDASGVHPKSETVD